MKLSIQLDSGEYVLEVNFAVDEQTRLPYIEDYWTPDDSTAWTLATTNLSDVSIHDAIWQAYDEWRLDQLA